MHACSATYRAIRSVAPLFLRSHVALPSRITSTGRQKENGSRHLARAGVQTHARAPTHTQELFFRSRTDWVTVVVVLLAKNCHASQNNRCQKKYECASKKVSLLANTNVACKKPLHESHIFSSNLDNKKGKLRFCQKKAFFLARMTENSF